jgi:hypothetical protein
MSSLIPGLFKSFALLACVSLLVACGEATETLISAAQATAVQNGVNNSTPVVSQAGGGAGTSATATPNIPSGSDVSGEDLCALLSKTEVDQLLQAVLYETVPHMTAYSKRPSCNFSLKNSALTFFVIAQEPSLFTKQALESYRNTYFKTSTELKGIGDYAFQSDTEVLFFKNNRTIQIATYVSRHGGRKDLAADSPEAVALIKVAQLIQNRV